MSYSVQIANIYELLNEDDAPQAKGQQKTAPAKGTQAKAPAKQTQAPQKTQQKDNQKQTRPPRQDRPPRQQGGDVVGAAPKESHERQGGFRERRDKNAGFSTGSKRVYDRKPGSGRGREYKKGGSGKANWGKEGEENAAPVEEGKETTEEKKEEKTEEKTEENVEKKEEVVEEEDKTITLEEYLKNKETVQFKLPEARKANEGVDNKELKKWQGYQVLKREGDEEEKETAESGEKKEKKPKKTVVPLDQIFDVKTPPISTSRGRGRGRGRGGSRGSGRGGNRGGRGGNRGGQGSAEIKIDERSFPSLAPTKA